MELPTSAPSMVSEADHSSPNAAAIGGGIGGGLGGVMILVCAAYAFWRYRRSRKAKAAQPHQGETLNMHSPPSYPHIGPPGLHNNSGPISHKPPVELPYHGHTPLN